MARATTEEGRSLKAEAILEAALALFAERGFHGTAVPTIAERAGVGAGTVYRYFESKEAVVNALYQRHKKRLAERMLGQLDPNGSAREQFHLYWTTLARFARENPIAFEFLELHHHGPYLVEASLDLERQLVGIARARFVELRAERVVKDVEPEVLMAMVHGAFVGLFKAHRQGWIAMSDEEIAASEQCMWEAIRA